jgi:hypothetical protein
VPGRGWRCTRDSVDRDAPSTGGVTTSRSLPLRRLVQVAELYWADHAPLESSTEAANLPVKRPSARRGRTLDDY